MAEYVGQQRGDPGDCAGVSRIFWPCYRRQDSEHFPDLAARRRISGHVLLMRSSGSASLRSVDVAERASGTYKVTRDISPAANTLSSLHHVSASSTDADTVWATAVVLVSRLPRFPRTHSFVPRFCEC